MSQKTYDDNGENVRKHFIKNIIDADLASGKNKQVITRFPPEPNGYLHIGHAKSICLNFSLAREYGGKCHLRFDDTNPEKESDEYVEAIKQDIKWLGYDWGENLFHASDYFEKLYDYGVFLIKKGKAYVCDLSAEELRKLRGDLKSPGKESPYRKRSASENLDLFARMKNGEFENGEKMLRAKIDMASPNINMRDPVLYRIKKVHHQRTGDKWPIYPMYDYTHCLSDSIEGITHSLCTLEFEDHRPLYDWVLNECETEIHPQQIEFSRLNLEYTIMSKRFLLRMVEEGLVSGWDDPRMPTITGMRRRGYTPESIRNFCEVIGITKKDSSISMSTLEYSLRNDLGPKCPRVFGVIRPLKVVITNWEDGKVQNINCPYHPQDEAFGNRDVPFTREIYIEQDDFTPVPPKKFFRLGPGKMVRLKYGYVIQCDEMIKNEKGEVQELRCTFFEETFAGARPEGFPKVKGIINWVSATHGLKIENRLYDRLLKVPFASKEFTKELNPESLVVLESFVEPALKTANIGERVQFERQGYFIKDQDSTDEKPVYNRIITLKDTWAKIEESNSNKDKV